MMRYIKSLERKDLALNHSMISLGSCTMKLNSANLMIPLSFPEWGNIHPFSPINQAEGYQQVLSSLKEMLIEITGFSSTSLQPNAKPIFLFRKYPLFAKLRPICFDAHINNTLYSVVSANGVSVFPDDVGAQ